MYIDQVRAIAKSIWPAVGWDTEIVQVPSGKREWRVAIPPSRIWSDDEPPCRLLDDSIEEVTLSRYVNRETGHSIFLGYGPITDVVLGWEEPETRKEATDGGDV
jgi:hypothetical protein